MENILPLGLFSALTLYFEQVGSIGLTSWQYWSKNAILVSLMPSEAFLLEI
jgi:hypothetical protein